MPVGDDLKGKSDFADFEKANEIRPLEADCLGQPCPQDCPQQIEPQKKHLNEPLGQPLSIREVAELIGCSTWTVRHRYLRRGLPRLRAGSGGKLIFYKSQVIRWLLRQLEKGGTTV